MSSTTRRTSIARVEQQDWAQPIVKESLGDQAYRTIRGSLMRGQLRPGAKLLLRPLSARFGISATPMREALMRLVSEKALTLDGRGTVVVPRLTLDQLLEIRAIRIDLEGRGAAAAAELATEEEIDALAAVHDRIAECHQREEFDAAVDLNTEFHLELCRLGRFPIVHEVVESLWVRCGPILSHLYDAGIPSDWDPHPHLRVIQALRERDPEAAREAIREDIERGGQGLLDHVRKADGSSPKVA